MPKFRILSNGDLMPEYTREANDMFKKNLELQALRQEKEKLMC